MPIIKPNSRIDNIQFNLKLNEIEENHESKLPNIKNILDKYEVVSS